MTGHKSRMPNMTNQLRTSFTSHTSTAASISKLNGSGTRLISAAIGAAISAAMIAGMTLTPFSAKADEAENGTNAAAGTAPAAATMPDKLVDYDFTDVKTGNSTIINSVHNSAFGDATITGENGQTIEGTFTDEALTMGGDYYVKLPDDILSGKKSATVSTVVKNDEFNSSGPWTYLWVLGSTGQQGTGSWTASTHTSLYGSITSKANGAGETFFSASENLSMNAFQTLTATIDGETNVVTMYINGRQVGSTKASTNPSEFSNQNNNTIGNSRYPGVGDAFFHGNIRNFTVYDGAMTQQQVAQSLSSDSVSDLLSKQAQALSVPSSANSDFTLPQTTDNAAVTWQSNNQAIAVDNETGAASVTLPTEDTTVELTATLHPAEGLAPLDTPITQTFKVKVPKSVSDDDLRALIAQQVTLDNADDIRGNLLLPATMNLSDYDITGTVSWKSSNSDVLTVLPLSDGAENYETVVTRPDCGEAVAVTLTATISQDADKPSDVLKTPVTKTIDVSVQPQSAGSDSTHSRVTVHDPSIVKANGKYYSFGSHRAFARSTDLQHWEYFHDNLTDNYQELLGDIWKSWPKQDSNPDLTGNMWAPEVIWNPTMNKWTMYLSVNGDNWRTVMVLLTADDIEGDWTVVGPVIYSGFNKDNASKTDVYKVLSKDDDLARYQSPQDTEINAIDASVKIDDNGDMWMALGSWFGGIWMIKLDPATGLRDYRTTYETKADVSDAYYGHKLAGGHGNSGEGIALTHVGDYWYMMLSYSGLTQTGGYQMREFRSKNVYGPYVDQNGNSAIYTQGLADNKLVNRGLRILSSYDQPNSKTIKTSQGGNAILNDDDGSIYNVFHTRFVTTEGNLEGHEVRVQQMVVSPDGWLVMTPYEKSGTVSTQKSYTVDEVTGDYSIVVHNPVKSYAGGGKASDAIYHAVNVKLEADGTLSGAAIGTWTVNGTDVTLNVTSSAEGALLHGTYQATIGTQMTETGTYAMFFTGLGGDVFTNNGPDAASQGGSAAFWGTKAIDAPSGEIVACTTDPSEPGQGSDPGSGTNGDSDTNTTSATNVSGTNSTTGSLSNTGSDTAIIAITAALLTVFGILAWFARRRNKHI